METFSDASFPLKCPSCQTEFRATLKQVTDGSTICQSCNQSITLEDGNGSVGNSITQINKALENLSDDLSITFKLG